MAPNFHHLVPCEAIHSYLDAEEKKKQDPRSTAPVISNELFSNFLTYIM